MKLFLEYSKFMDIFPKINSNETISNIENLFQSRELFINDNNITNEYIHFIRPINEAQEKNNIREKKYENIKPYGVWKNPRPNQYNRTEFYNLCRKEQLLDIQKNEYSNKPVISVIVKSYNKGKDIFKSIRSIQNQSIKNIEIIIVDDGSTDNSKEKYKLLLKSDPRIRIFYHLKNMGIWRTCLDGFLYSKSKYFIYFDMEDSYTYNYVLEDAYNLTEKYELDSVRFSFIRTKNIDSPYSHIEYQIKFPENFKKIIYGTRNNFDVTNILYGSIWNRLTRANDFTKGLYLLDDYLLNVRKNLWEDRWINVLINKMSFNYLMINRAGYLYFNKRSGEAKLKIGNLDEKFKMICEFINFWIFDLKMLPQDNNKKGVINSLRAFNSTSNKYFGIPINLNYLHRRYIPYENLLVSLIEDPFVKNEDKIYANNLYNQYKKKLFK